jgi:hypothetical protein
VDQQHFDGVPRSLRGGPTRRHVLRGLLAAAGLGWGGARWPAGAAARRKRTRTVRRNAFGCVDVGGFCTDAGQCCSGVCRGKRGKKRCRAHDADVCTAGQRDVNCGGQDVACTSGTGQPGVCETTTGNAPYCAGSLWVVPCATDRECRRYCGPRAACLRCGFYSAGAPTCAGPDACSDPDEA